MTWSSDKRLASVQQQYVRTREIIGDVLCLATPSSLTRRTYRAVLNVSSLNFLLKAEEEQEALIARYRSLLKALTFPLQIVIRHERLDLRPSVEQMHAHLPEAAAPQVSPNEPEFAQNPLLSPGNQAAELPGWADLVTGIEELLQQVSNRHTLIARHWYVIIPAPDAMLSAYGRRGRSKRRQVRAEELITRSLQELAIRVEIVQTQLAALGLRSRRLGGAELACLYYRFLSPDRALQHPLHSIHLASVGHLPQVVTTRRSPSFALRWQERCSVTRKSSQAMPGTPEAPADMPPEVQRRSKRALRAGSVPAPDFLRLADLFAPASITETRDWIRVDEEYVRGIAIIAFPREVSTSGWLAPLLQLDEILEICFHLHPQDQATMMRLLRRRRVGFASARVFNRRQGRLDDPDMEVAQNDVTRLMHELASGEERLFEVSLFVLVRAPNETELAARTERIRALLQTIFLDAVAHPTTFEHALAFRSFLPEGHDALGRTITLDSASLATTFPFCSNSLTMPGGTFLGLTGSGEPVLLDPWHPGLENPHAFVGGVTGAGKSYFGKLWLARTCLLTGREGERFSVVDPDGEYTPLARALGGTIVRLAAGSAHHLNPFALLPPGCNLETYLEAVKEGDRLAEKIQDLHSLLDLLLADPGAMLGAREKALLDRALYEVYRRVGISADPHTHFHQPPLLRDLADVLKSGVCGEDTFDLGWRLSRYIEGSLAGLFAEQTNVRLDSHLLVWDIRDLRGDLRPIGIFLIADCLWTQAIYQSTMRRALLIDEAASLIEHAEGGRFLANLSRRARKRYLRLVVMTQNPEAFAQDEWGSVVAANAAIKMLKKQDRTSVRAVATRFGLTAGEEQRLLTFGAQEALLFAGDRRVLLTIRASVQEHALITTNPIELANQALAGSIQADIPPGEVVRKTGSAMETEQEARA